MEYMYLSALQTQLLAVPGCHSAGSTGHTELYRASLQAVITKIKLLITSHPPISECRQSTRTVQVYTSWTCPPISFNISSTRWACWSGWLSCLQVDKQAAVIDERQAATWQRLETCWYSSRPSYVWYRHRSLESTTDVGTSKLLQYFLNPLPTA